MKKLLLILVICTFAFGMAYADDPGTQDSVIIQTTVAPMGTETIYVWMYAVTDDSVFFYNIPLSITSTGQGIHFDHVAYFSLLLQWDDTYDSFLVDENYLRMIAWADIGGDDNPSLHTLGARLHVMNLVFTVDPGSESQVVSIDTTYDPVNGSLLFGLEGGVNEFVPAFVPGEIMYGALDADDPIELPTEIALRQNYPNPFNPETNINFELPASQDVSLEVYNILGQNVKSLANGVYEAGYHTVSWNGTNNSGENVPSGIYFYSLKTADFSKTNKMMLIR